MVKHLPVMLKECVDSLNIKPDGIYVDLTLGRGGHSSEILKNIKTGKLISFDKDIQAIKESRDRLGQINNNFELIHSDFKNLKSELEKLGIKKVDGILADLGVSSPQLDETERGFSYSKDSRLDMRMNQSQELDAFKVVNEYSDVELVNIFSRFADVKLPRRVAKGIVENRPIETTLQLVEVIKDSLPAAVVRAKNPAKAVFQAIRIEVNGELDSLTKLLEDATDMLNVGGTLSVITFHSIEDRIVKKHFAKFISSNVSKLPINEDKDYFAKTYKPSKSEIESNRRSRSAKLRTLRKTQ